MSNEIIKDLARLIEYRFADREVSKFFNSLLNFEREAQHKAHYKCSHEACCNPSIDSHELSKEVVLKPLSNSSSNVYFLIPDYAGNSLRYIFKERHIEGATTFPGYCCEHDNNIFLSMEDNFSEIDSLYIHKQALRTLKKEIYQVKCHVEKITRTLKTTKITKGDSIVLSEKWYLLFNRLLEVRKQLNRYNSFYRKLWQSIKHDNEYLHFQRKEVENTGVAFSGMYDFREMDSDGELYGFIFLIPIKDVTHLIVAAPDSIEGKGLVDDIFPENMAEDLYIQTTILQKRSSIVFSERFFSRYESGVPEDLYDMPEFVTSGIIPCVKLF